MHGLGAGRQQADGYRRGFWWSVLKITSVSCWGHLEQNPVFRTLTAFLQTTVYFQQASWRGMRQRKTQLYSKSVFPLCGTPVSSFFTWFFSNPFKHHLLKEMLPNPTLTLEADLSLPSVSITHPQNPVFSPVLVLIFLCHYSNLFRSWFLP